MHAYVINLARSADRRANIVAELAKTGLEYDIVTAVDGRTIDVCDRKIVDPSLPTKGELEAGTVGAALSHLRVYEKVIEDGLDTALVLEDDLILPADLDSLAEAVAAQLAGAEVALLSYDSPDPCRMSTSEAAAMPGDRVLALPIDIHQPRSGGAYVITREACERMIKCVLPVRVQADTWAFFYDLGALDRVRCVVPLPVRKHPGFASTIGSYAFRTGLRARLVAPVVRRKIPVVHQLLCYRRKRIYRQWGRSELVDLPFIAKPSRLD